MKRGIFIQMAVCSNTANNNVIKFLENLAMNPSYDVSKAITQKAQKINTKKRLLITRKNIQSKMAKQAQNLHTIEAEIRIVTKEIERLNQIIDADPYEEEC